MSDYISGAVVTLNGKPVECVSFNYTLKSEPRLIEPQSLEWSCEMTMSADDSDRLWDALGKMIRPRSSYWTRRQRYGVRQFRKRLAHALGVSYREIAHFCRTGKFA